MKYTILKALDVAGLKVLEPIVRLVCGEEPQVQIKKIGLFILIPITTFLVFLGAWAYVGPRHKTKSGEVPGPSRVVEAWNGIVQFANREKTKGMDFSVAGDRRERTLKKVDEEYAQAVAYAKVSTEKFKTLEKVREKRIGKKLSGMQEKLELQEQVFAKRSENRETLLLAAAEQIPVGDKKAKLAFLGKIVKHLEIGESETEQIKAMRSEIDEQRQEKWDKLEVERKRKNSLDQAKQFLVKRKQMLSSNNRSVMVAKLGESRKSQMAAFMAASGSDMLQTGKRVIKTQERIQNQSGAEYVGPPSLFKQTWTSLKCVFIGFLIASAIAIPIGVLCGLSDVFMAAMSPLISLFKPVSPIVWLPIVFIIVGGFSIPEVKGTFKWLFEPAFLASSITVALCSLWPTLVNTALGVASIDKDHVNVARVLRLGFWSRLFKIVIPSALPLIFAGLRISLGVGWMVLIAAELLSSSPGLGKYVWDMFNNGSSETFAQMFVVVFVVGLIGLLLDRMMIVFQRLVSFDGAATAL